MGWASSADYMQGTQLAFRSKEDAIAFVSHSFELEGPEGFREGGHFSQVHVRTRPDTWGTSFSAFMLKWLICGECGADTLNS